MTAPLGAFFPEIPTLSSCADGSLGNEDLDFDDLDNHDFDDLDDFNGERSPGLLITGREGAALKQNCISFYSKHKY